MTDFTETVFTAPSERIERFSSLVRAFVQDTGTLRVLDIGCGTGSQILNLGTVLYDASFLGIDISAANIEQARRNAENSSFSGRINFEHADYMAFSSPPYDVVIADSCIQWIEGDSGEIIRKIATDIKPGGLLFLTAPVECLFNDLLIGMRKALRALRGSFTDWIILATARLLHGRRHDAEFLRQRVSYMYWIPYRLWGDGLRTDFLNDGLFKVELEQPLPHASLGQPKHCMTVLRRNA
ncbi:MAG: class I SAM-dependent methyltransferase [Alphaproteobacteria bacterium]|jgi:SAM-dependent methyltransferase|nr:class I SAM-dependent methyltransferase [Alphaproteobacteria bacterium]